MTLSISAGKVIAVFIAKASNVYSVSKPLKRWASSVTKCLPLIHNGILEKIWSSINYLTVGVINGIWKLLSWQIPLRVVRLDISLNEGRTDVWSHVVVVSPEVTSACFTLKKSNCKVAATWWISNFAAVFQNNACTYLNQLCLCHKCNIH